MDLVFLDTNAFYKLYVPEIGSTWLRNYVVGKRIVISELAMIESATALGATYRNGRFSKAEAAKIFAQMNRNRSKYQIIDLGTKQRTNRTVTLALNLPKDVRVRGLDAIQLAAAMEAREAVSKLLPIPTFTFITADIKFFPAIRAAGFVLENPEDHL